MSLILFLLVAINLLFSPQMWIIVFQNYHGNGEWEMGRGHLKMPQNQLFLQNSAVFLELMLPIFLQAFG